MDNPGVSLFQGEGLKINNTQNQEEAEDLEDRIRRREELKDLLTNALDDFKYDDSTVNSSSNTSLTSCEEGNQIYRNASSTDQLKVLYEIRTRENKELNEQFNKYKEDSEKQIKDLKQKLTLAEADARHYQISLKSSESLLVEKVADISTLKEDGKKKDEKILELTKKIEELQLEVFASKTNLNELAMKLKIENSGFNLAAKHFNSEELQKHHQSTIKRLETLLDEQKKRAETAEKDRALYQEQLQDVLESKRENETLNNETIICLNNAVQNAQQQCKELVEVIEYLSTENEHFKGRVKDFETNAPILKEEYFSNNTFDSATVVIHNERLKRMLVDKDVEIKTLKIKLKYYEKDLRELLEYRKISTGAFSMKECDNKIHAEYFVILRNELDILKKTVDEKQKSIENLNVLNKELQEKIEDMLRKTRDDIQTISEKYSLPQLDEMSNEIKSAQIEITKLQEVITKLQAENQELKSQLSESRAGELKQQLICTQQQIAQLQEISERKVQNSEKLMMGLQSSLAKVEEAKNSAHPSSDDLGTKTDLQSEGRQCVGTESTTTRDTDVSIMEFTRFSEEIEELQLAIKDFIEVLHTEPVKVDEIAAVLNSWWKKLYKIGLNPILKENLDLQLSQTIETLKLSQNELVNLKDQMEELTRIKGVLEEDKFNLNDQLRQCQDHLRLTKEENSRLQCSIDDLRKSLRDSDEMAKTLNQTLSHLEDARKEIGTLQEKLKDQCLIIKNLEETKAILDKELHEKCKAIKKLEECKAALEKNSKCMKKIAEEQSEVVKRLEQNNALIEEEKNNLKENFRDANSQLENARKEIAIILQRNIADKIQEAEEIADKNREIHEFKSDFEAALLKKEIKIREEIQEDYGKKIKAIEEHYLSILTDNLNKVRNYKEQENSYRQQLGQLFKEWAAKITPMEAENATLKAQLHQMELEYDRFKHEVYHYNQKYSAILEKTREDADRTIEAWKGWAKKFVQECLRVEKIGFKGRESLLNTLKELDKQVVLVEKQFDDKINRYRRKHRSILTITTEEPKLTSGV